MALCTRLLITAVLVAGLGIAPAAHAQHWHGGGNNYHQGGGNYCKRRSKNPSLKRPVGPVAPE